jgi:flagellar biosynthesis/type III secretory pathway protein FliH
LIRRWITPSNGTTPLDAWLYFLRSAEGLDPEALPGPLDTPEIRQAMEALTMLTRVDIQKEIYEGRIKARRDERMRWIDALAEGRAEGLVEGLEKGQAQGLERGVLIGRIEFAQRLLRREGTPRADLEAMPREALEALAAQLEQEAAG